MEMTQEIENSADTYDDLVINFIGRSNYAEAIKKAEMKGLQEGERKGERKGKLAGKLEGKQEGLQEGERKGERKGERNIALNMLRMKYPIDEISKITKMSKAEIRQLAQENNLAIS